MSTVWNDVRFALRLFRRSPGFAAVTILSLALGIGATTAVFSVIRAILFDPYPYKDADRMVHVELHDTHGMLGLIFVNDGAYKELQQLPGVDDVFSQDERNEALTGDQFPVSVHVGRYSSNLFNYMGVPMLLGRGFSPADAPNDNPTPVAVLSYLFWEKQYNASPDILGKRIELDHAAYTVIGVAPPRFTWGDSDVYLINPPSTQAHDYRNAFIKMKPGVTRAALLAQLQPFWDRFAQTDTHGLPQNVKLQVVTLNEQILGRFQGALIFLFSAVLLLLLIGCANVSILMLARGTARQHEFAIRSSIGAARPRLIQQLLTESVLLSFLGAALGVLLAYQGIALIVRYMPTFSFPHEASAGIHVNATVLAFSTALALLTGILFGISPAWQITRPRSGAELTQSLGQTMQSGSSRLAGKAQGQATHRILIAGQVALTMLLLATAGTAIRGFMRLYHTPLGFDPGGIFFMDVTMPKGSATTWQERANITEQIRRTIAETPGVESASISNTWYPPIGGFRAPILVAEHPDRTDQQGQLALISPELLSTLHLQLLQGRNFTPQENARAAHVALVNRTFVRQFYPGQDPIGHRLRSPALKLDAPESVSAPNPDDWLEIVGVVEDARNDGMIRPILPAVFLPETFVLFPGASILGRAAGDPEAAIRNTGTRLHHFNPDFSISHAHPLPWVMDNMVWATERFMANLFGFFALLALALAAAGLYSVVSYTAARRTQEMGLRIALGATRAHVVRIVLGSSLAMVALGAAIGLAISLVLAHWLANIVQGSSRSALNLLLVSAILLAVAAIACGIPAWRAASIDPMRALREE